MTSYRIIHRDIASPAKPLYGIYQVQEDEHGQVTSWTDQPFPIIGRSVGDVLLQLQELQALLYEVRSGVLVESELNSIGVSYIV